MITATHAAANKQNSQKSTGPTSSEGRARSSKNATKHGLLSARLFLDDENRDEFQQLMNELITVLTPVGMLELVLVERIAVSMWRQRRLIRAETAAIELFRRIEHGSIRTQVETALGIYYPNKVKDKFLEEKDEDDTALADYCGRAFDECSNFLIKMGSSCELETLREQAPITYEALEIDADAEGETVEKYLQRYAGGLVDWMKEQKELWLDTIVEANAHTRVLAVVHLVKSKHSTPSDQELISRYQTALDNETYKAIRALREAQEWRLKTIDAIKPVTEVE